MYYDLLVVGILVFFTLRGALKGVVWQVAGIAGIVLCFMFADGISAAAGPYIKLDPPLNHWVALAGAYLALSFVCFGLARAFNEWMEKNKFKEFDRHLGAVFGLVKGVILSMILTFFVVTVSDKAHEQLKNSHSARYSAIIMDRLHPILPEKLHDALARYIHRLDSDDLPLHAHDGHDVNPVLGPPGTIPGGGTGSLWDQLTGALSGEAQKLVNAKLQQLADPAQQQQLQQEINRLLTNLPENERNNFARQLLETSDVQLERLVSYYQVNHGSQGPQLPPQSNEGGGLQPVGPANPPLQSPNDLQRIESLVQQLASSYPGDPASLAQQIQGHLAGIPQNVCLAVLSDWHADVQNFRSPNSAPDPDRGTDVRARIEQRLVRQLEFAGVPPQSLSPSVQQRLGLQAQRVDPPGNLQ